MEPDFLRPIIAATCNVFTTMLQLDVRMNDPALIDPAAFSHEVTGVIGLCGDVSGSIALSWPVTSAERIATLLTGVERRADDDEEDFIDAIGELVNMVAGNAKSEFMARDASITCPTVYVGRKQAPEQTAGRSCVAVPCQTDCGTFVLEIRLEDQAKRAAPAPAADHRAA